MNKEETQMQFYVCKEISEFHGKLSKKSTTQQRKTFANRLRFLGYSH